MEQRVRLNHAESLVAAGAMLEDLCRLWGRPGASPREALEGGGIAAAFEIGRAHV